MVLRGVARTEPPQHVQGDLLPPWGRNRPNPHFGHLNATEYRGRDAGDALAPVSADAECRGGAHDEGRRNLPKVAA